jgi:AraC-like DNA-binding protein
MIPDPPVRSWQIEGFEKSRVGQLSAIRQALASVFDVAVPSQFAGDFKGDFAAHCGGHYVLSDLALSQCGLVRNPETLARSKFDFVGVSLVERGVVTGCATDDLIVAQRGDVYFLDLAQTSRLEMSADDNVTRSISLWISKTAILEAFALDNMLHGLVIKHSSPAGALIGASLGSFAKNVPNMAISEMNSLGDGLVALIAKVSEPALRNREATTVSPSLASFVTVRRYIDRNLASAALDVSSIAKNFGLSRASVYRLFEPVGGIASYIRKARLKRAYREITAAEFADQRIGQIAFRFGFSNVSTFNRLFLTTYGVSPSKARKRSRHPDEVPVLKSKPSSMKSLAASLAGIETR